MSPAAARDHPRHRDYPMDAQPIQSFYTDMTAALS